MSNAPFHFRDVLPGQKYSKQQYLEDFIIDLAKLLRVPNPDRSAKKKVTEDIKDIVLNFNIEIGDLHKKIEQLNSRNNELVATLKEIEREVRPDAWTKIENKYIADEISRLKDDHGRYELTLEQIKDVLNDQTTISITEYDRIVPSIKKWTQQWRKDSDAWSKFLSRTHMILYSGESTTKRQLDRDYARLFDSPGDQYNVDKLEEIYNKIDRLVKDNEDLRQQYGSDYKEFDTPRKFTGRASDTPYPSSETTIFHSRDSRPETGDVLASPVFSQTSQSALEYKKLLQRMDKLSEENARMRVESENTAKEHGDIIAKFKFREIELNNTLEDLRNHQALKVSAAENKLRTQLEAKHWTEQQRTETKVREDVQKYLSTEHTRRLQSIQRQLSESEELVQSQLREFETARRKLEGNYEKEIQDLESKYDLALAKLANVHETEKKTLEKAAGGLRTEIFEIQQGHKVEMEEMKHQNKVDISLECSKLKERLKNQHQRELVDAEKVLRANFEAQKLELTNKHLRELSDKELKYQADLEDCENQIKSLQQEVQLLKVLVANQKMAIEDQELAIKKYEKDQEDQEAEFQLRTEGLKKDNATLQGRLLTRDKYNGLKDSEIMDGKEGRLLGFKKFCILVEAVSNWEWDPTQTVWPTQDLQLSKNQKRLKKYILGDLLWSLLFSGIFCSPFRLLGDEGIKYEEVWKSYTPDPNFQNSYYTWPKPTLDSEKFRYETCEEALLALTQAVNEHQSRGKLKMSYIQQNSKFKKQVLSALSHFVRLDSSKQEQIEKLITEAVKLWLVFCSQRCRFFVVIPGSESLDMTEKVEMAQNRTLRLTVTPKLQRYGNNMGLDLQDRAAVVAKGESEMPI